MRFARLLAVLLSSIVVSTTAATEARADALPEDARGWEKRPSATPEEVALAVPRAILTPPRLVLQVVFLPIREGLKVIGRHASDDDPAGQDDVGTLRVSPRFFYLSGFGPTVGASATYENLGGHGEEAELVAGFGGMYSRAAELSFHADHTLGSDLWLETLTRAEKRPEELFQGTGEGGLPASRYSLTRVSHVLRAGVARGEPGRQVKLGGSVIVDHARFAAKDSGFSDDPSIERVYDVGALPGFARGVDTMELQTNMIVDTRDAAGAPSRGVSIRALAGGVPSVGQAAYVHTALDVTGFVDLYRGTRVLVLRGAVESVDGKEAEIPFLHLPRLGGPEGLRGYRLDRFRDRKSVLSSVEYRYPIHDAVAGALFLDAGHVAPSYAGAVSRHDWHVGAGAGVRIRSKESVLLSLDVAYGDGPEVFLTVFPPARGGVL